MKDHELTEYHRLRSEGRWTAASEFRESERKRLRAAGRTRQQARDESFEAMLEKFPPQDEQSRPVLSKVAPDPCDEDNAEESETEFDDYDEEDQQIVNELKHLALLTSDQPVNVDRDIDFAYHHMSLSSLRPLMAPSTAAWQWYLYARDEPHKFLEIYAKRADAKAKSSGVFTQQMMEDDKRKQFAILDRIEQQLTLDVNDMVDDLMSKFPEDVLLRCRKHKEAWEAFFRKYPESIT